FGLEKLLHIERAITHLEAAMDKITAK
ncbi:MAG: hypothetical protein RL474_686, partial [Pseudomonadota bacterium]